MNNLNESLSKLNNDRLIAECVFKLSYDEKLKHEIEEKYVNKALRYYEKKGNFGHEFIAKNLGINSELMKIYSKRKSHLQSAVIADKIGDYESLEKYLNLWKEEILKLNGKKLGEHRAMYSRDEFKTILENTSKGTNSYSKYMMIKNITQVIDLKIIEFNEKNQNYHIAAEFCKAMGEYTRYKQNLLNEIKFREKKEDYHRAYYAAKNLGMDEKARSIKSKEIDQDIKRKQSSYNFNYEYILKKCEEHGFKEKIPKLKEAYIQHLIYKNNNRKVIEFCIENEMFEKAKELETKAIKNAENQKNYSYAISLCKQFDKKEKIPKLYEKRIEQTLNEKNSENKYYSAYQISKSAGLIEKAKEFALESINQGELDIEKSIHVYDFLKMPEKAQFLIQIQNLSK
jgi:hypothetical protein